MAANMQTATIITIYKYFDDEDVADSVCPLCVGGDGVTVDVVGGVAVVGVVADVVDEDVADEFDDEDADDEDVV
jgi:hypothetical protein